MKRKIYLEVEFDWEDYDDVSDELILEDSGILDAIKDGVQVKLFAIPDVVGRSEQLVCDHPDEAIIKDKPTDYCLACNRNI